MKFTSITTGFGRVAALAALGFALAGAALADEMTLELRNGQPVAVDVELYSQARDQVWPGGGAFFRVEPGASQSTVITCTTGESICYGAWPSGNDGVRYGVGPDGIEKCETCCFTCDSGARAAFDIGR